MRRPWVTIWKRMMSKGETLSTGRERGLVLSSEVLKYIIT